MYLGQYKSDNKEKSAQVSIAAAMATVIDKINCKSVFMVLTSVVLALLC
jgi:hypothetical protein